jgi:hypothetical protein
MKIALLWLLLAATGPVVAAEASDVAPEYEYAVVFLAGTANGGRSAKLEQLPSGAYLDRAKTDTLNQLAADGWEVISVAGDSGADHAVYLRRAISAS